MFEIEQVLAFSYRRHELAVIGWCAFDDLTPVDDVWVVCGGERSPCLTGIFRPEIGRRLDAPALADAGFLCRFPVSGRARATLVATRQGRDQVLGEFPADWSKARNRPEADRGEYATWLRAHEAGLSWPAAEVEQRLTSFSWRPTLSILLPTYNTHLYHLRRCIDSIASQLYPHWELCITDDGSSDPRVKAYLTERASAEPRIRLTFAEERRGISVASNRSIAASTGDFILLLDHDDEFHPSALLEVARCLNEHPDTDLIYSDEDKIDQIGVRSRPTFKPDFDDDLLCGFDYIGHLVAIRTVLARYVGGFRREADGAQDWDLLLRVVSATEASRIQHIPKPLYHWRMHEDSTAYSLDSKPYAVRAWDGVLRRHLDSARYCSVTEGLFRGSMRIARELPNGARVSVLYRASDGPHQRAALNRTRIPACTAFFQVTGAAIQPGDAFDRDPASTLDDLPSDVTIVVNGKIDSVNHHFLEELAAQAIREDCGIVGGTILRPDGTVLTAGLASLSDGTPVNPFEGMAHYELGYMGLAKVVRHVSSIGPQVFAFRTSRLRDVGGLAVVREDGLGRVCAALVRSAHAAGLKVLHTPYAVASLRSPVEPFTPLRGEAPNGGPTINQNIAGFPAVAGAAGVYRAGIT